MKKKRIVYHLNSFAKTRFSTRTGLWLFTGIWLQNAKFSNWTNHSSMNITFLNRRLKSMAHLFDALNCAITATKNHVCQNYNFICLSGFILVFLYFAKSGWKNRDFSVEKTGFKWCRQGLKKFVNLKFENTLTLTRFEWLTNCSVTCLSTTRSWQQIRDVLRLFNVIYF